MSTLQLSPGVVMNYLVDDYTDPWVCPETVLFIHGMAESSAVWFGWIPHLARDFRVVRPDMRGFGASTAMPMDYPWSLDAIIDDYTALMRHLNIGKFHLVSAKIGGTVARRFAARHPELVLSLTVVGSPPPVRDMGNTIKAWIAEFKSQGIEPWARRGTANRLGSRFPAEGVE